MRVASDVRIGVLLGSRRPSAEGPACKRTITVVMRVAGVYKRTWVTFLVLCAVRVWTGSRPAQVRIPAPHAAGGGAGQALPPRVRFLKRKTGRAAGPTLKDARWVQGIKPVKHLSLAQVKPEYTLGAECRPPCAPTHPGSAVPRAQLWPGLIAQRSAGLCGTPERQAPLGTEKEMLPI